MLRFIFISLFVMALCAGALAYYFLTQKPIDPFKLFMNKSGYSDVVSGNQKQAQDLKSSTSEDLDKIRRRMDDLVLEQQQRLFYSVWDQNQVLENANIKISEMMDNISEKNNANALKLKDLNQRLEDKQGTLSSPGQGRVSDSPQKDADFKALLNIKLQQVQDKGDEQQQAQEEQELTSEQREDEQQQKIQDQQEKVQDQQQKTQDEQQQMEDQQQRMQDLEQRIQDQQNR